MNTTAEIDDGGYHGTVPPPMEPPPRSKRHWIDQPADLVAAVRHMLELPLLAIDVEFVAARPSDTSSIPRLALIQIADAHQCWVIDALQLYDLTPLNDVFTDPRIMKIFQGIGSDLPVLAIRNVYVDYVVDLEAISRSIFGSRESGLQAMFQRACNMWLDKSLQRSDWTQRPLPTAMFAYAARDAEVTLAVYQWLCKHFDWAIPLYEDHTEDPTLEELVAPWLAVFIQGERTFPSEFIDMKQGIPSSEQLTIDCLDALDVIIRPIWRARVLRAAADLALKGIIPETLASLQAPGAEERSAAVRALGRLRAVDHLADIETALHDPVFDVRNSAVAALEQVGLPARIGRFDRHEPVPANEPAVEEEIDAPWKSKLRDMLPPATDDTDGTQ